MHLQCQQDFLQFLLQHCNLGTEISNGCSMRLTEPGAIGLSEWFTDYDMSVYSTCSP